MDCHKRRPGAPAALSLSPATPDDKPEPWYACLLYSFCCFLAHDPHAAVDEA